MNPRSSSEEGFSLVELAIVLTILGLIAGFSVPLLTDTIGHKKWLQGDRHMEEIITALAAYVVRHQHLPCPADPSVQGSERGKAQENCASIQGGLVPYKTLGLPETLARDGFQRPFSYYTDPALTRGDIPNLETFCKDSKENLILLGERDRKLSIDEKNPVAFVLVGHGETGEGSFDKEGGRRSLSSLSATERANAQHLFRQQIKWITRDHLLSYYAKCPCPDPQKSVVRSHDRFG